MSALDLFASALGAFILISIILFPYFPNTGDSKVRVAEVQAELENAQQQLEEAERRIQELINADERAEYLARELEQAQQQLEEAEQRIQELMEAEERARQLAEQLEEIQAELAACQSDIAQAQSELVSCRELLRRRFLLVVISWPQNSDVDLHIIDPQGREFYFGQPTYPGTQAKLEVDAQHAGNEIWLHPEAGPGGYQIFYNLFNDIGGRARVTGAVLNPDGKIELRPRQLSRVGEKVLVATVTVDSDGNVTVR